MWIRPSVFVIASLMLLSLARADGELSRPLAASALALDSTALVSWIPAIETPDSYNVYGIEGDSTSLLASVGGDDVIAEVAGGFASYAVTAVIDGVESTPTLTSSASSDGCLTIYTNPPGVDIGNCGPGGGGGGSGGGNGGSSGVFQMTRRPFVLLT